MCTVTIVPLSSGIRLACNRDESRQRPAASPPELQIYGTRQAILPIDPIGGGTWIAASDAGLACTLLNVYEQPRGLPLKPPGGRLSRGLIIPALLDTPTLTAAVGQLLEIDVTRYAAFRLVIADRYEVAELVSSGTTLLLARREPLLRPVFFTSSGLGDHLVGPPRSALFQQFFGDGQASSARQDAFHRHQWPGQEHLSVCMSRTDARTVSYTTVEIGKVRMVMHYHAGAPNQSAPWLEPLQIPRHGAESS